MARVALTQQEAAKEADISETNTRNPARPDSSRHLSPPAELATCRLDTWHNDFRHPSPPVAARRSRPAEPLARALLGLDVGRRQCDRSVTEV